MDNHTLYNKSLLSGLQSFIWDHQHLGPKKIIHELYDNTRQYQNIMGGGSIASQIKTSMIDSIKYRRKINYLGLANILYHEMKGGKVQYLPMNTYLSNYAIYGKDILYSSKDIFQKLYQYNHNNHPNKIHNYLQQYGGKISSNSEIISDLYQINTFQMGGHQGPCEFNNKSGRCRKGKEWDYERCALVNGRCKVIDGVNKPKVPPTGEEKKSRFSPSGTISKLLVNDNIAYLTTPILRNILEDYYNSKADAYNLDLEIAKYTTITHHLANNVSTNIITQGEYDCPICYDNTHEDGGIMLTFDGNSKMMCLNCVVRSITSGLDGSNLDVAPADCENKTPVNPVNLFQSSPTNTSN